MNKIFKKYAFTVAEVLITLSIIGIVTSFIIPKVKLKYQEIVTVSKVRKTYSVLNSSYQVAIRKYGSPKYWGLKVGKIDLDNNVSTFEDNEKFFLYLLEGLNYEYVKDKIPPQATNYLNNEDYSISNSDGFERQPLFRLVDGVVFFHSWYNSSGCTAWGINSCGDFSIDINGAEGPNILGIDQFEFFYTESAIVPMGYSNHINKGGSSRTVESHCRPKDKVSGNGYGCAAWVVEKGTMPWLYGKQASWN